MTADLAAQYKTFSSNVSKLADRAKAVASTADQMSGQGEKYMQKWDEEVAAIQNEDIQKRTKPRQDEVGKQLGKIHDEYQALWAEFQPLMSNSKVISAALKTDMTVKGVEAIKGPANRAQTEANKVLNKAQALEDQFRALGVALAELSS
jgi:hypothetical protein